MSEHTYQLWPILEHYGWQLPRPRQGWQTVKCAIHGDSKPSCRVNNELGAVICHACGFSGDSLAVIRYYEKGMRFSEVVKLAEALSGNGDESLRAVPSARSALSRGSRHTPGNGSYVPPGRRARASGGR